VSSDSTSHGKHIAMKKKRSVCQQQKILCNAATNRICISHDAKLTFAYRTALTSRLTVDNLHVGYFFFLLPSYPQFFPCRT